MRDIRASAEVTELIGAETLRQLREGPEYGPFLCWHCGFRGDANTEPVTVIAEHGPDDWYTQKTTVIAQRDGNAARTALAHAECSPSQAVSTDDATAAALAELGPAGTAARSGQEWQWQTMLSDLPVPDSYLPTPDGFLPLLILDVRPELAERSGPDEQVTRCMSALRGMGLTPVTTISQQLANSLDGKPANPDPWDIPQAPGWRFELYGHRVARVTGPDGSAVWAREFDQPFRWRMLATRTGRCVVLVGAIGLYRTEERPFTWLTTRLDRAAQAGELVGGLVETGWCADKPE